MVAERKAREDLKWYLLNKYRALFIDKITGSDLEELQYCLKMQHEAEPARQREYRKRFVLKMRGYMPEEVLKNEVAGLESLLTLMRPEDLSEAAERVPGQDTGAVQGIRAESSRVRQAGRDMARAAVSVPVRP
jgi:hypothetical protein